jgi:hypothetical protein
MVVSRAGANVFLCALNGESPAKRAGSDQGREQNEGGQKSSFWGTITVMTEYGYDRIRVRP